MKTKKVIIISLGLVVVLLIVGVKAFKKSETKISVETSKVMVGNVSNTITATGTLEALRTISVGTQVSGVINKIYVDFNSHVKAGQLLAELDKRTLITSLENAQANLENAQAEMTLQTSNYNRIKALSDKNLVSQNDYDQAIYNYTKAESALKTAKLDYDRSKINLNYASIYSPIDGIVLERAVDEGQTVAASFNTPTLFSIANDLTQMQVEASIDEADIGKVKDGQSVSFTVDAFPDMKFDGRVVQIRLQPVVQSNVVTYTVVVKAHNPDMKLMPGMTANITVYVEEAKNVLLVPSKALHFTPDQNMLQAYMAQYQKEQPGEKPLQNFEIEKNDSAMKTVWIKSGEIIHPMKIKTGIDDDLHAQILEGLNEGDEVVTGMNSSSASFDKSTPSQASSPFMPRPPSRSSSSGKTKKS